MIKRILAALLTILLLTVCAYCEEEEPMYSFDLDAYGGMLNITYSDDFWENTEAWGFCVDIAEGLTTGDVLKDSDIAELTVVHDNEEEVFEGWLVFELTTVEDEFGFSENVYTLLNEIPLTTEEMLATPASETYTVFAAKWASIPAEEYYPASETIEEVFYMASATLFSNEGTMLMHSEEEDYEAGVSVGTTEPGLTIGEVLELDNLLSVTREGYEFAGWTVYDVDMIENTDIMPEDENLVWFETFEDWYTILHDCTVIAENIDTNALREIVCGETDLFIAAQWK